MVRELEAPWSRDFDYPAREWRRLISEVFDTLLLVMVGVGAGGAVVDAVSGGQIGRGTAVTAPGPGVLAIILFMGAIGNAHLNTVVSLGIRDAPRPPVASSPRLPTPTRPNLREDLQEPHVGTSEGPARTFRQRTDPTRAAVRVWQPRAGEPTRPGPKLTVTLAQLGDTSIWSLKWPG